MNSLFLFVPAIILMSLVFSLPPVYGPLSDPKLDDRNFDDLPTESKAIPDWVKNNFKWYVDGAIDQQSLLTSMNWLIDNNYMHLSDQAAKEVDTMRNELVDIRKENVDLRKALGTKTDVLTDQITHTRTELANKINLDPNLETKIIQYDEEHNKWIAVLSIDWGSDGSVSIVDIESEPQSSADTYVFPHLLESDISSNGDDPPTEEVAFYFNKLEFTSDIINDLLSGDGTASDWSKTLTAFSEYGLSDSVVEDLQKIIVLCNNEVSKKTQTLDAELNIIGEWLDIIEKNQASQQTIDPATGRVNSDTKSQYRESDLDFIERKLANIDRQILALDTGINVMEEKLFTVDALQTISNISKNQHDTLKAIIQNMRA